jgi:hypothetical protein
MRQPSAARRRAGRVLPLLVLGLVLGACERPAAREEVLARLARLERPHIVLIVVDALRADRIAPYGFDAAISPELARWAEHGVVFERVLAQSSWTKVSMASLLTSLWPRTHGVRLASDGLAEPALTLAEVLRDAGYRTYAVQSNGWLEQSFGFHQGFEHYVFARARDSAPEMGASSLWPHAERVLEEAGRLLDAHDEAQPFFLYLHFMDVHEYAAPPEFRVFGADREGSYLSAIRWLDDVLQRLRERLERQGLLQRTVIVFASDHGEAFGENRSYGHARNVLIAAPDAGADRPSFAALGAPILAGVVEQISVDDGSWSLARNLDAQGREFLFDREVDPQEDVDLVALEPAAAERMRAVLDSHWAAGSRPEARATGVRIDPAIAERLRAMGYLQ